MPSSLTITAQYSFTPYTKARAIQLNTNFSNLRGHMLPIDPTSTSASDQAYNLGSSLYRWRTGYLNGVSLSISTGSSLILSGTTAGGFKFTLDSTIPFSMISTNYKGHNATPVGPTLTAAKGQWAESPALNATLTTGAVAGSTCTLSHNGRLCFIGFKAAGATTTSCGIELTANTTGVNTITARVIYMEDGNTLGADEIGLSAVNLATTIISSGIAFNYAPNAFGRLFVPNQGNGAGTNNYYLEIDANSATGLMPVAKNLKLFIYELQG